MRSCLLALPLLLIGTSTPAVTMAWTPIGDPGNADDSTNLPNCGNEPNEISAVGFPCGSVAYEYLVGTYEVTNAQYVEFLNAKAASDPLGLYNANMSDVNLSNGLTGLGGITRSGASGSYTYATIAGRGNLPVNNVSFYDVLRFANWMNNGQGTGATETGSYTITPQGIANNLIIRNEGATIFLTNEDEWFKAAYYNPATASYFTYPAGSNTQTSCVAPTTAANSVNCDNAVGDLTAAGSYSGSPSPYGTFDQGGNAAEWVERIMFDTQRALRGGSFDDPPGISAAHSVGAAPPNVEYAFFGFRLTLIPGGYVIPEPSTGLLVVAGLLGLSAWRRARA
jgi:formylglycine-generating enzyme required for sulfatase activity